MPVISVNPDELQKMTDTDQFELIKTLPKLGIEIEKMEDDAWDLEIFPDRCDMLSVEGLARTVKGFLKKETGMPEYEVKDSDIVTDAELSVQDVRPYIVTAMVKDVEFTDDLLKSLMDVQEKLHLTLGRGREKVAIGIHDYEPIEPPFTYKAVKPEEISFIPLQKSYEMNLQEILDKHEKGQDYAWIVEGHDKYPIILDKNDNVLSFPPVINGVLTEVSEETTDIFIDMTGTDEDVLRQTLNIICALFADRGGEIYSTKVRYGSQEKILPDMTPGEIEISQNEVEKLLGVEFENKELLEILARERYDAVYKDEDTIELKIPPYRHDILHPWDIVEDIAIGYDMDNFEGEMPTHVTVGKPRKENKIVDAFVETMMGYGFQEVINYTMSNPEREFSMMELKGEDEMAMVENPVTEEYTGMRIRLLPTLLDNLRANRNKSLPQKLFEVGDIVKGGEQFTKASGVIIHSESGFTETKSIVEGIANNLGLDIDIEAKKHNSFIEGRCASVIVGDKEIGYFGEVHPKVLENFDLEYPTTAFEFNMNDVFDIKMEREELI